MDQRSLDVVAEVDTGVGTNYQNVTPDGEHRVIASGGSLSLDPEPDDPPTHFYTRVDADRESDSFGEVTGRIEAGYTGPCDATLGPDGEQWGSESIWDISDPEQPAELAKITPDDGLPGLPITSEVGPDRGCLPVRPGRRRGRCRRHRGPGVPGDARRR